MRQNEYLLSKGLNWGLCGKELNQQQGLMEDGWRPITTGNLEHIIPLPDDRILDRSNLKQSADDNFKFDENSRKFSKRVENTVGKGEIAHYEHSLFPTVFSKGLLPKGIKRCHCVGMG